MDRPGRVQPFAENRMRLFLRSAAGGASYFIIWFTAFPGAAGSRTRAVPATGGGAGGGRIKSKVESVKSWVLSLESKNEEPDAVRGSVADFDFCEILRKRGDFGPSL